MSSGRVFLGEAEIAAPPLSHRGLAYGDGIFETMRGYRGTLPWWDAHWRRAVRGAARLRLPMPSQGFAQAQALAACQDMDDGIVKLVFSRDGERGYAPLPDATALWIVSAHPAPPQQVAGLHLRWCETRLARQPLLAGIKHCNRLEQVLARAEWSAAEASDRDADDGLLCDTDNRVICATAANVFVLHEGRWRTPALTHSGVAGVCREWVLHALAAREQALSRHEVETAEAVFLCNAVRGILPVARLGQRQWPPHPAIDAARKLLAQAHPAFAMEHT